MHKATSPLDSVRKVVTNQYGEVYPAARLAILNRPPCCVSAPKNISYSKSGGMVGKGGDRPVYPGDTGADVVRAGA